MSKPEYSVREDWKSLGFGYASDMVARAVNNDDAEGFMKYIEECGGSIKGGMCSFCLLGANA